MSEVRVYGVKTEKGLYLAKSGEDWCTHCTPEAVAMWDDIELARTAKKGYEEMMVPEDMIGKVKFKIWSRVLESTEK